MRKNKIRKVVMVFAVAICLGVMGGVASAAEHTDSVSFGSNNYWGFSGTSHAVDFSPNTGVRTRLAGFTFNGMPSNTMPSGTTKIYFKLVPKDLHNTNATDSMSHTYQDYSSGTYKSKPFKSGIAHPEGAMFTLASKSNASLGATVSGKWKLYY